MNVSIAPAFNNIASIEDCAFEAAVALAAILVSADPNLVSPDAALVDKEETSLLVAEISEAKASSSLETLKDKEVTSAPVALISAAKASSSLDILNAKELTSPLVALISAAKASSSSEILVSSESTVELVAVSYTHLTLPTINSE